MLLSRSVELMLLKGQRLNRVTKKLHGFSTAAPEDMHGILGEMIKQGNQSNQNELVEKEQFCTDKMCVVLTEKWASVS